MPENSVSRYATIQQWFAAYQRIPFPYQYQVWNAYLDGRGGLLNAPTGSGKTLALWIPPLVEYMENHPEYWLPRKNGLQVLWITPLRALAKDLRKNLQHVCDDLNIHWQVGLRTADTSGHERKKQTKQLPECLITTPESLHVLLSQKEHARLFQSLKAVVVDEWHELLGSKRGTQTELALSRLRTIRKGESMRVWGISATIGNLTEALQVLHPGPSTDVPPVIITSDLPKKTEVVSILPDSIREIPWAGHLGVRLLPRILPIIEQSTTTLLFTNTRAQTEIWYQHLLLAAPELAGQMAMHHGSLDQRIRTWVEEAIADARLKVVVCTSSLDLGVDFSPVESIIQIGSPKGIARFMQRAGRSGHQPGATSRIYFVPTYALEVVESAALQQALSRQFTESRHPVPKPMDVLVQYLVTRALGDGFREEELRREIEATHAYAQLTDAEWYWALDFITTGGNTLGAYDEFTKVSLTDEGRFYVASKKIALRHRLSIGTIVSEPVLRVKFLRGAEVGTIDESFISRLKPGDVFWLGGKNLEFVRIREMTVWVRRASHGKGSVPRWQGSRLEMSSPLAGLIREQLTQFTEQGARSPELQFLQPLLSVQQKRSRLPEASELLIEQLETREGYHVFIYPFEGRIVHEILSALVAYRISRIRPISFTMAMNDYGFELLSDTEIPLAEALERDVFSADNLLADIEQSINETEMAKRRFREIAAIAGLVFQGYPGKGITNRHLQASAQLIFDVFQQYDPENLLVRQAYQEVLNRQLEQSRLALVLERIRQQQIRITQPKKVTPLAFPILIDRLRQRLSSEKLEDRIAKMQAQVVG